MVANPTNPDTSATSRLKCPGTELNCSLLRLNRLSVRNWGSPLERWGGGGRGPGSCPVPFWLPAWPSWFAVCLRHCSWVNAAIAESGKQIHLRCIFFGIICLKQRDLCHTIVKSYVKLFWSTIRGRLLQLLLKKRLQKTRIFVPAVTLWLLHQTLFLLLAKLLISGVRDHDGVRVESCCQEVTT